MAMAAGGLELDPAMARRNQARDGVVCMRGEAREALARGTEARVAGLAGRTPVAGSARVGSARAPRKKKGDGARSIQAREWIRATRGGRGSLAITTRGGCRRCAGHRYGRLGAHSDAQEKHSEVQ